MPRSTYICMYIAVHFVHFESVLILRIDNNNIFVVKTECVWQPTLAAAWNNSALMGVNICMYICGYKLLSDVCKLCNFAYKTLLSKCAFGCQLKR